MKRSLPILLALSAPAAADDQSDRLFAEGRALVSQSKPDEACAKFQQAFAIDRHGIGILLNIGLCNERQGKVATAVKHYREVVDHAEEQNNLDAKQAAVERLAVLAPIVPRVTLTGVVIEGETIVVDDQAVPPGEVELDPGDHRIVASAPGFSVYETHVRADIGKKATVEIPRLDKASHRKLYGTIGMAAGGAFVATSAILFGVAHSRYDGAFPDHCDHATGGCDHEGQQTTDSARTLGNVGTAFGIVGLVAVATGAALYFTAPHVEAVVVPTAQGVAIAGRF